MLTVAIAFSVIRFCDVDERNMQLHTAVISSVAAIRIIEVIVILALSVSFFMRNFLS